MPPKPSSAIHSVLWLPPHWLEVTFRSGDIHRYEGVSQLEAARLQAAPSKGSYFNTHIKGKYRSRKIGKLKIK